MRKMESKLEQSMILYHGSKSGIVGKVRPTSRANCDFGTGFYMGANESDIFSFVCDSEFYPNSKFYKLIVSFSNLKIYTLSAMQWLLFVLYNRNLLQNFVNEDSVLCESLRDLHSEFDILIGPIADDAIFAAFDLFLDGYLSDFGLYKVYTAIQLCDQIVAVSEKACSQISVEEVFLDNLMRKIYHDARVDRLERSHLVLKSTPKEYNRVGHYFEEYCNSSLRSKRVTELPSSWYEILRGGFL